MHCPDETQIARLVDGTLDPGDAERIDMHLDTCPQCRGLVADLFAAQPARLAPGPPEALDPGGPSPDEAPGAMFTVGRRYAVQELIGQGGMGRVYRAVDRLTGRAVALKQVRLRRRGEGVGPQSGAGAAERGAASVLPALAQEFRALASLRHPHIISVLDYGFDAAGRPYFTMDMLAGARPLLPFAASLPRAAQVDLLVQLLGALAYLHRAGILHRDVKPTNLLLAGEAHAPWLKVVDFGLASSAEEGRPDHLAGTPLYMAPELFGGGAATEASDLYAAALVAYEMFSGRHPFHPVTTVASLIAKIKDGEPDLAPLPPELRGLLGRALHKRPEERPRDAAAFLHEIAVASGRPESAPRALRSGSAPAGESRLVSARFTGREEEIGCLSRALAEARAGRGSTWLVGGESGVGKSCLLEELRSRALVLGVLAVRGQALASGGTAFHVFRSVLAVLALHVELSPLEASVLRAVVPNVGALLGREVPEPPEIDAASRFRLLDVLRDVVQRSRDPVLMLLEDLQWADPESTALLAEISAGAGALPLLVAASYRDDEAPALPASLPAATTLKLDRFQRRDVGRLCASMLGPAGRDPRLVERVARETRGNAYFVVEVARLLAEEAAGLDDAQRRELSDRLLAGGVDRVLDRRISRVPAEARELLQLAAVAGRELDLEVLSLLVPRLEDRVRACADAGVLEVYEERYRFYHDKLRERVLGDIDAGALRDLHLRVAGAFESVHGQSAAHFATIAHHYRTADRPAQAAHYHALAGEAALARGTPQEAESDFEQAIALHGRAAPTPLMKVRAWRGLAHARFALGKLAETEEALRRVFVLAGSPLPGTKLGLVASLGRQIAEQAARRAGLGSRLSLRPESDPKRSIREELLLALTIQEVYVWLGRPEMLLLGTFMGLNLEDTLDGRGRTNFRGNLAFLLSYTPLDGLVRYYLDLAERAVLPGTRSEMDYLRLRALVQINRGRWAEAAECAARAVSCARERRDDLMVMHCLLQHQIAATGLDDYPLALSTSREAERLAVRHINPRYEVASLLTQGSIVLRVGDAAEAEALLARAEERLNPDMEPLLSAILKGLMAMCAHVQGQRERARALALEAAGIVRRVKWTMVETRFSLASILEVLLSSGDPDSHAPEIREALARAHRIAAHFPMAEPSARLFQGRWDAHRGRTGAAATSLRCSLRAAELLGARYEQAMARYSLGCLARSEAGRPHVPEGAELHLREALAIFEALGAHREVANTTSALQGGRFPPVTGPTCLRA